MAVLLVTYDLNKPGQKHLELLKKIKDFSSWACLSESSYAIKTNASASEVFDALRHYIDDSDTLYVINLKKPYSGFGPKDVNDWLDNNLPS
ncbi:hypothetical protein [Pleionea mediterranea]|uniref:Uncharacterized protein n=1 Tax=Pleionea mediterranea TaxID=523701 RepID=A0A316GDV1_9GAMM|nr:hypothetical protein [Pleionea mediterranea]PWK52837.1 hypothetical protein C8D97_10455 [Pleionea mediterranea]